MVWRASIFQRREDLRLCSKWKEKAKQSHELVIEPNRWMKCFNIQTQQEVEETNERIIQYHTGLESEAREERKKEKKKVLGVKKLKSQPLDLTYKSKKESIRICVYSLDAKLRAYLIEQYERFCEQCKECYEQWKIGNFSVVWPPGALLPPAPSLANEFAPLLNHIYKR